MKNLIAILLICLLSVAIFGCNPATAQTPMTFSLDTSKAPTVVLWTNSLDPDSMRITIKGDTVKGIRLMFKQMENVQKLRFAAEEILRYLHTDGTVSDRIKIRGAIKEYMKLKEELYK